MSEEDIKYIIRFICAFMTIISNTYLLSFILRKLQKGAKKLNNIFVFCIAYIILSLIATLYNTFYRYIIKASACKISDIFEESMISLIRSTLLLFYVIMIYEIFDNSKSGIEHNQKVTVHTKQYWKRLYGDNKLLFYLVLFILIIHMIILPAIYILHMIPNPIVTKYFGVYCQNTWPEGELWSVILYQVIDCGITLFLCILFVFKLLKFREVLNQTTSTSSVDKVKQEKLYRLARKSMILTFISISSSWILIAAGRLDPTGTTTLRWFYPLDHMINSWCLFLIFEWKEFQCCCLKTDADYTSVESKTNSHAANINDASDNSKSQTDSQLRTS